MWWERDGHLEINESGHLAIGGMDAVELAKKYGTPLYVYNRQRILDNYRAIRDAFASHTDNFRIHYAMKANSNPEILKALKDEGAHIDSVSPYEARIALESGFPVERIMFTGTSVSDEDLLMLLEMDVFINIDSLSQIRRLSLLTDEKLDVSLRWNPGVGAGHHGRTITAGKYVKFGIPESKIFEAARMVKDAGFNLLGLHQHIGSGWLSRDVPVFLKTVDRTIDVASKIQDKLSIELQFIDFGGGPGIPYRKDHGEFPLDDYARGISEKVAASKLKDAQIAVEPGRYIVGDAGVLLLEINTVEEKNVPLIGVNGGFNTLVRPSFYGSYHEMVVCNRVESPDKKEFMVAGNLCESGDVFNENKETLRELPVPHEKDILAILNAGAYGYSMASNYNSRPMPAEVMVDKKKVRVVRETRFAGQV
ncbi:MAG: diaminopimelate decarboxylase [archaeon]